MKTNYIDKITPHLEALKPLKTIPTAAKTQLKSHPIKALIFDIYGTLMISASGDIDQADYNPSMIRKAFVSSGIELINDSNETIDLIHSTFNTTIKKHKEEAKSIERPYPEVDILEVWQETLTYFEKKSVIKCPEEVDLKLLTFVFELQTNKVWPMPNMEKVIKILGEKEIQLGIISNAQFYTPVIMNYFLHQECKDGRIIAPFQNEITVYSFEELRLKPDVKLFNIILKELEKKGITAAETAFVGNDMLKDMWAASQSGVKTIFFAGDQRAYRLHENDERCKSLIPDFTITNLSQLLEIIE